MINNIVVCILSSRVNPVYCIVSNVLLCICTSPSFRKLILGAHDLMQWTIGSRRPIGVVSRIIVIRHMYLNCCTRYIIAIICVKQELACLLPMRHIGEYVVTYQNNIRRSQRTVLKIKKTSVGRYLEKLALNKHDS
jgi:hypothetical protein